MEGSESTAHELSGFRAELGASPSEMGQGREFGRARTRFRLGAMVPVRLRPGTRHSIRRQHRAALPPRGPRGFACRRMVRGADDGDDLRDGRKAAWRVRSAERPCALLLQPICESTSAPGQLALAGPDQAVVISIGVKADRCQHALPIQVVGRQDERAQRPPARLKPPRRSGNDGRRTGSRWADGMRDGQRASATRRPAALPEQLEAKVLRQPGDAPADGAIGQREATGARRTEPRRAAVSNARRSPRDGSCDRFMGDLALPVWRQNYRFSCRVDGA